MVRKSDSVNDSEWRSEVSQIITNFMQQRLSKQGFQWKVPTTDSATSTRNDSNVLLGQALNVIADAMMKDNGSTIRDMSTRAVTQNILDYQSFKVIADEMFAQGFQWSHIVMLLLFGSELASVLGLAANPSTQNNESTVSQVNDWLIRYFSSNQNLKQWIMKNGRWDGVIDYAGIPDRSRVSTSILLLAIGSLATVTLATFIHFFVKA